MATNNFKPFATGTGANVLSQAEYEALAALAGGFTSGKASSAQINKAIRQATFIAAALAQYVTNKSGQDVLDDGNVSTFITKMATAFGKDFQALDAGLTSLAALAGGADKLPYYTAADVFAQTSLTSIGRALIGKATQADALSYLGGAPLASPGLTGTPTAPTASAGTATDQIATMNALLNGMAAFGLGARGATITSLDSPTATGMYIYSGSATNSPGGLAGAVLHIQFNTTNAMQIAHAVQSGVMYHRYFNTTWSTWGTAADLASPAFTGTPTAPTAAAGTSSTQLATTAFVQTAIAPALVKRGELPSADSLNKYGPVEPYIGLWGKAGATGATIANGYPEDTARGMLEVYPYGQSNGMQKYTISASGNEYVRTLVGTWNGVDGPWSAWFKVGTGALADIGLGLASIPALASFDWQQADFTTGSTSLVIFSKMTNVPTGLTYSADVAIFIRVAGISGNGVSLELFSDTVVDAAYNVYEVIIRGNKGARTFTIRRSYTSADTVPITNGGTGAATAEGAIQNLLVRENLTGIVGATVNAKMTIATASATGTFTADEIIVADSLAGRQFRLTAFSKTVNLAATGANGMETGTAPTSGFVALYAIYNPTTAASALLAVNATSAAVPEIYGGANMPSGYTASALLCVVPTDSTGKIAPLLQMGRKTLIATAQLSSTTAFISTPTALNISAAVPKNAKFLDGILYLVSGNSTRPVISVQPLASPAVGIKQVVGGNSTGVNNTQAPFSDLAISTAQTIYWQVSAGVAGDTISSAFTYATGYSI